MEKNSKVYRDGYDYAAGRLLRKELTPEELIDQQDCNPNEFDDGMNAAVADIVLLRGELDRLEKWVDDLQSGMYINCVYCGHRYGPDDNTNPPMRKALEEHIATCPKHPLSLCKKELAASRALEASFFPQRDAQRIAEMLIASGFGGKDRKHGNTLLGMTEDCLEKVATLEHLHNLDHSLADQWQAKNEGFIVLASALVANAVVGPDAAMKGSTDCYHVPLDDIEALRQAITDNGARRIIKVTIHHAAGCRNADKGLMGLSVIDGVCPVCKAKVQERRI
jgi:hypothetical protein